MIHDLITELEQIAPMLATGLKLTSPLASALIGWIADALGVEAEPGAILAKLTSDGDASNTLVEIERTLRGIVPKIPMPSRLTVTIDWPSAG